MYVIHSPLDFLKCFRLTNRTAISSNLQVYVDKPLLKDALARLEDVYKRRGIEFEREPQKTVQQGCSTTVVAALDPEIEKDSGAYLVNGNIDERADYAGGEENWEKLWKLSEKLVGEKFDW